MIGFLAGIVLGVALGTVSGLLPGIHVNTLAVGLLAVQAVLIPVFGVDMIAVAMMAALVTHTFLDIIPSTFLGIPDADTAISVIPSHVLCLEGNGEEAVRIAALGSAWGFLAAVPLCFILLLLAPLIQNSLDWAIGIILTTVAAYLILSGESPLYAFMTFIISGILGIFTLYFSYLGGGLFGSMGILMPLLSGLFGISLLLVSSQGKVPEQSFSGINIPAKMMVRGGCSGTIAGIVVGWLPGLSNATANGVIASVTSYNREPRGYIFATSTANTVNAIVGLAAFYAILRTRNGVMVALSSLEAPPFTTLLAASAVAAVIAYLLTVSLAASAWRLGGIKKKNLYGGVILFIIILTFLLCGLFGIMVLVLATLVGLAVKLLNISQVYCIGAIMLPVIFFSFGITFP
ncbi:MAG: tripartite tricarboxylate transporter permease [Methanoregulaceae archaeon]|jgi:putative membrane protein|nr:tripartite tricarboxylate transporter permease [Methanoregulaceae archaeon]